jgi:TonB family protein
MLSHFLKRILPFALTLIAGLALGGFTNLFRTTRQPEDKRFAIQLYETRLEGTRRHCYKSSAKGVGRLVSIQRQTADGEWVATRPVGPEIYELTTRPAIIHAPRPDARYSDEALARGTTGTVLLEATLSSSGRVTNIVPRRQLSDELTVQAVMAAEKLQFEPAIKEGRPVSQRIMLEYDFEL